MADVMSYPPATKPITRPNASLVARAQAGDGEAFAVLFEQHKRRVYSLCLLMTGDVADAEDLTQDAFIQVFRKLKTFRGDSAFSTWLYRVAVNTVLMSLRKRKPKQVSLDEPVCVNDSMVPRDFGRNDPELSGTVDRIALLRAIQELPEGYRRIFLLHEVDGYQHHEIATMLRCSVGNSKSQLHKAKLKIRELLMLGKPGPAKERKQKATQACVPVCETAVAPVADIAPIREQQPEVRENLTLPMVVPSAAYAPMTGLMQAGG
jgi:RNA polymerase sigma-70 factor (ECF subfamily)